MKLKNLKKMNNFDMLGVGDAWERGLKAGLHTLFKQETRGPGSINYRLFIDEFEENSLELHSVLNELMNGTDQDTLEIRLSSPGGIVSYGLGLINVIRSYFYNRTITVIDSLAASMAALVFVEGTERLIHEESVLMFHEVSLAVHGKASEISALVKFEQKQGEALLRRSLSPYFKSSEIDTIINGGTYWLNAEEICKRGLSTGVIIKDGLILSPKDYLLYLEHPEYLVEDENGQLNFNPPSITAKRKKKGNKNA